MLSNAFLCAASLSCLPPWREADPQDSVLPCRDERRSRREVYLLEACLKEKLLLGESSPSSQVKISREVLLSRLVLLAHAFPFMLGKEFPHEVLLLTSLAFPNEERRRREVRRLASASRSLPAWWTTSERRKGKRVITWS